MDAVVELERALKDLQEVHLGVLHEYGKCLALLKKYEADELERVKAGKIGVECENGNGAEGK